MTRLVAAPVAGQEAPEAVRAPGRPKGGPESLASTPGRPGFTTGCYQSDVYPEPLHPQQTPSPPHLSQLRGPDHA